MGTYDVCEHMYTDMSMHTHAHKHRCTYSYVRGYTHTGLHALQFAILAPNSMQSPSTPPSLVLPLLTFHLQYLKHQGQHSLKGNTPILSFYTLKKPYFTLPGYSFGQMLLQRKTDGGPSRFLSSCPHHLAPQIHLPAVKDTVAPQVWKGLLNSYSGFGPVILWFHNNPRQWIRQVHCPWFACVSFHSTSDLFLSSEASVLGTGMVRILSNQ